MVYREVSVIEIREALRAWLAGKSERAVAAQVLRHQCHGDGTFADGGGHPLEGAVTDVTRHPMITRVAHQGQSQPAPPQLHQRR